MTSKRGPRASPCAENSSGSMSAAILACRHVPRSRRKALNPASSLSSAARDSERRKKKIRRRDSQGRCTDASSRCVSCTKRKQASVSLVLRFKQGCCHRNVLQASPPTKIAAQDFASGWSRRTHLPDSSPLASPHAVLHGEFLRASKLGASEMMQRAKALSMRTPGGARGDPSAQRIPCDDPCTVTFTTAGVHWGCGVKSGP